MDEIRRILVFILCGISVVSALSIKGYYCRDPDTGKLYPTNSTWPSSSFCGNYTCKLRKKMPQETEILREFNVTGMNITQTRDAHPDDDLSDGDFAASNITPQIVLPTHTPNVIDKELNTEFQNELNKLQERLKEKLNLSDGDRFLTDTEIKTISDLLHNVKKSDLEAIVDIYNLAQDIYKEMDKVTSQNILEETVRLAQDIQASRNNHQKTSYWYDPVNKYHKVEVKPDMQHQGTHPVPTTAQPKADIYFSGQALSGKDFGKLPYYYPMSNFQRQSSYVHPSYLPQPQLPPVNIKPPCTKIPGPVHYAPPAQYNYQPAPNYPAAQNPPPQNYGGVMKRPFTVDTQRLIQPSVLLPYPFSYVQHYNMSAYPFNLYDAESNWARFDVSNNKKDDPVKENKAIGPKNAVQDADKKESSKPKSEDKNIDILEGNLLESLLASAKIVKKPEWQTDPIPAKVLEEVRAHFEEKANKLLKPLSLRKKIKLERVGKVVKLDDLHRERRSAENEGIVVKADSEEELEAYLEKTTCRSEIDPGFYKMGNLSEPYPACCPHRIDGKR